MPMPDYYAILEVSRTASPAEIRHAYRQLVRRYHPDARRQASGSAVEASEAMKLINEAYAVLSNPQKRARYDAQRRMAEERRTSGQPSPRQEHKMTWKEGIIGFVRELKKALKEE